MTPNLIDQRSDQLRAQSASNGGRFADYIVDSEIPARAPSAFASAG
jgi:hypothetical protein